ncbi:DUF202 domain-containing protein [Phycicoccus endophyticus]|uniref:DUF202 domain-containing protein n=1 Tax=Phycicoccus endophyticus TaxID=1690220 RepID=A0A7G9QZB3_9MICO|nr:DUF202 domain-containing protein [Phycicoccus endophyticus]NHI19042.1 DUF202 domain-containing protein [Phycicoccus endophyticus]QNN48688.1 DUF202 domain-containing protein [Phycicoccus endophyticus]GGL32406.1 hypothetical protein GCM10012283_13400 [Phycicoccus endophyticus]
MREELVRDPGMQQERTTLAWRRTGLALLVGSLTIGRLTLDSLGPAVLAPTALTAAMALYVVLGTLRQRRLGQDHPQDPRFSVLSDGRLVAVVAAVIGALSVGELAAAVATLL